MKVFFRSRVGRGELSAPAMVVVVLAIGALAKLAAAAPLFGFAH